MTTQERIRRIFLQPQPGYSIAEATELLEYSDQEIARAVGEGDLALEASGGIPRVPWEELALAAAEKWSQEIIEAALGQDLQTVMPELVRLTDLQVRLGRIAQRDRTTINEVVARQLLDLAVAESELLERSISGIGEAIRWPLA